MTHLRSTTEKEIVELERAGPPRSLEDSYPLRKEDEINLLDYLIVLLKHKKLIICLVFLAGLAGLIMTRGEIKLYESEAIIVPQEGGIASFGGSNLRNYGPAQYSIGKSSSEKLLMVLDSRQLTARIIEKYNLKPVLFSDMWDEKGKKWKTDTPPTLHYTCEVMKGLLTAGYAKSKGRSSRSYGGGQMPVSVSIRYNDPETAKEYVDYYLTELSETLRGEALRDAAEKKRFLEKQLETIIDPFMKEKIHILRANEIEKETFAQAQRYYGFTVLDPPVVSPQRSAKKSKRTRNITLAMTVAFFLAAFLALIIEYARRIETDDTERYQEIIRELKTWKKDKGTKSNL